jgi:hypothetical protein
VYSQASNGCVSLISSGTSSTESAFYDASEDGNDVFFSTTARLAGGDVDHSNDLYDAHVCTSAVPCLRAPVSPPPCASGDSCKAAPAPQPPIFGAPPSETFSGAGNLTGSPPPVVKVKTAAQVRAEKLTRALRACRRKAGRRHACERSAQRKFGLKARKTTSRTGARS